MPKRAWMGSPALDIAWIVLLPVLLYLPVWLGHLAIDPLVFVGSVGDSAHFPGGYPWIDPNVGYQAQALGKLSADQWLAGQVPWWNPYNGAGLPLAAEAQPASLFLPFVLLYHFRSGVIWVQVLLQSLAGLCTYALLRRLRFTELAALTGGLLYELNGTLSWLGAPSTGPVVFLPMLLLGVEQLFARVQEGRRGGWLLVPIALAWSIYAGFPETAYLNGLFVGLWVLFRLAELAPRARRVFLGKLSFAVVVGLALSLPQVVPFVEYATIGFVGGHEGYFAHIGLPGAAAALTLMPGLFGPIFRFDDPSHVIAVVWGDIGGYLTALQLAVVLLAAQMVPRRWLWAPLIWIALSLGKTFDLRPLSDLVNLLPLMTATAFHRYAPPAWEFASVLMICAGIDAMGRGVVPTRRQVWLAFAGTVLCVLASLWLARGPISALRSDPAALPYLRMALLWLACALAGGLLLGWAMRRQPRAVAWLAAWLVIDALVTFSGPMRSAASDVQHHQPGVDFLREHAGLQRVYSMGPLAPNYGAYFKIAQINHNYIPVTQDWLDYVHERLDPAASGLSFVGGDPRERGFGSAADQLRTRRAAYEEVAVKYVLTRPGENPFGQTVAVASRPDLFHAPLSLNSDERAVLHWDVPPRAGDQNIGAVSVVIGNYMGQSDGTLDIRLCTADGSCAEGRRPLTDSKDNLPFVVPLDHALKLARSDNGKSSPVTITFTHRDAQRPVALWISGLARDQATTLSLEGSPQGRAPSVALTFVATGPQAVRDVYDGPDMTIYELPDAKPYFETLDGACTVAALRREHARVNCTTRATLLRREASYPGWSARVDGQPVAMQRARGLFQTVPLAPGEHDVVFAFRPSYFGLIVSGFLGGLLAWLTGAVSELAARRSGSSAR